MAQGAVIFWAAVQHHSEPAAPCSNTGLRKVIWAPASCRFAHMLAGTQGTWPTYHANAHCIHVSKYLSSEKCGWHSKKIAFAPPSLIFPLHTLIQLTGVLSRTQHLHRGKDREFIDICLKIKLTSTHNTQRHSKRLPCASCRLSRTV